MYRLILLCSVVMFLGTTGAYASDVPSTTLNFKFPSKLSHFLGTYCSHNPCGKVEVIEVSITVDNIQDFEIRPLGEDCKAQTCPVVFLYSKYKLTRVDFPLSTKRIEGVWHPGFIKWLPPKEGVPGHIPASFTSNTGGSCKPLWEWNGTRYETKGCLEGGRREE